MKPADKPVLCVVSSHPIKGASGVPTGFFLAELTHPRGTAAGGWI